MEQRSATGGDHFVEDTYLAPQFGMLEFLRRLRKDQLSVLLPDLFGRNLVSFNHLFLHGFLINKPEYIEHVLLARRFMCGWPPPGKRSFGVQRRGRLQSCVRPVGAVRVDCWP
jgi:hypothetical protein